MDSRARALERDAEAWGAGASAGLLASKLRDGTLTRARIELAAYCGHEGAHALVGCQLKAACACRGDDASHGHGPFTARAAATAPFLDWCAGLSRWSGAASEDGAPDWALVADHPTRLDGWVRLPWADESKSVFPPRDYSPAAVSREAGEEAVRKAMRETIIAWALDEDPPTPRKQLVLLRAQLPEELRRRR